MKNYLLPAFKLTLICMVFFCVIYTAFVWAVAQASPNQGKGFVVQNGNTYCYENIGQVFDNDKYFWSRPSAVGYNAAGSGGSNKGPSNAEYLALVQQRIDTFLVHHPGTTAAKIPADLVTASGSGLDPHISPEAAYIQVKRVAQQRHLEEAQVRLLVDQSIEKPLGGFLGPERVNVLLLNLKLENL